MASMYKLVKDGALAVMQCGAKLDLQNNKGWTPLMIACRDNQPDTAQLLIQRGAKLDLQNNEGWTALMIACRYNQPDTAQWLIHRGAKLDLQNNNGWTALMIACRYNQPDTAQWLIYRGAKLNLQNNEGSTALMFACRNDQPGTARWLIQCGAELDLQDNQGWTALMLASRYDQSDTVQWLIQRGAKFDLQNNGGWTALMLACCKPKKPHHTAAGLLRNIKLCYAVGANLDLKEKNGWDALSLAKYFKCDDAVVFLEFATASEVTGLLLGELRQPRSLVVAFYEEGLLTRKDCSVLQDIDLEGMGVTSSLKRRRILNAFKPNGAQVPRLSLATRRALRRVVCAVRRLWGNYPDDAFLTHDWVEGGANHDHLSGDIVLKITQDEVWLRLS